MGVSVWGGGSLCPGVSVRRGLCHGDSPYGNEPAVRILLECILVWHNNFGRKAHANEKKIGLLCQFKTTILLNMGNQIIMRHVVYCTEKYLIIHQTINRLRRVRTGFSDVTHETLLVTDEISSPIGFVYNESSLNRFNHVEKVTTGATQTDSDFDRHTLILEMYIYCSNGQQWLVFWFFLEKMITLFVHLFPKYKIRFFRVYLSAPHFASLYTYRFSDVKCSNLSFDCDKLLNEW